MPGLVGFTEKNYSNPKKILADMASTLETDNDCQTSLYTEENFGMGLVRLGFLDSEPQLVWNEDKTVGLILVGEIFNVEYLEQLLASKSTAKKNTSQAKLLLNLFEIYGEDFAVQLNGTFSIAIWNQRAKKLILINDRLGLHPIYYSQVNQGLFFASGVGALLANPTLDRSVNPTSIAQFITFDHLLDQRSLLTNVQLLPHSSVMTFANGQLTIRPYWKIEYPHHYQHRTQEDYLEELIHHLRNAIKRQVSRDKSHGLLLSGGLDSRFLLALLYKEAADKPLHTFTWGIPGCDDARIAQELAKKTNTQHHFFELKPDYLLHKADEAVRLTDGMANIINLHALATLDEETKHAQVIYKGFLGDAMMGFALQPPFWADYDEETAEAVHLSVHNYQGVFYYDREEQKKIFSKSFYQQVGDSVFEPYRQGMAKANHNQLAVQRLFFDYTQRVPRHTLNGVKVVRSKAQVRLPFADNDFVNFSLVVPPGYHYQRQLMRLAFTQNYPKLAQTPISDTGLPMVSCSRDIVLRTKQLVQWHINNRGGNRFSWPTRRPYKDYNNWFRTILRPWVEDNLLSQKSLERGYFNSEYIRQLVQTHMDGEDHTITLGALLSLELWHQQFID